MQRDGSGAEPAAEDAIQERIGRVLNTFAAHGVVDLVSGAWGCGVFKNDPATVASPFHKQLNGPFVGRFRRVVFAVLDKTMAEVFTQVLATGRRQGQVPTVGSGGNKSGGSKGRGKQMKTGRC